MGSLESNPLHQACLASTFNAPISLTWPWLLSLLCPPPECWDCRHILGLCSAGDQTQASCTLDKYSTNGTASQPLHIFNWLLLTMITVLSPCIPSHPCCLLMDSWLFPGPTTAHHRATAREVLLQCSLSWAWWQTSIILALRRLKQ